MISQDGNVTQMLHEIYYCIDISLSLSLSLYTCMCVQYLYDIFTLRHYVDFR